EQPHEQLVEGEPALRVLRQAELWPKNCLLRAAVSGMGFGGINAHIVLESNVVDRRQSLSTRELSLSRSSQDCELFLFGAETLEDLARQIEKLQNLAAMLSRAELGDLAATMEKKLKAKTVRAAIIASTPSQLAARLRTLASWVAEK